MKAKLAEVVVIGGGVIGTSIAYYLAREGADVALVDKDDIASGTSSACDGFIMLQTKEPGPKLEMALESAEIFQSLGEELAYDIEYRKDGGMVVIETEEEFESMSSLVKRQREFELEVELLDKDQMIKQQPYLSHHLLASTYSPTDAQVHPIKLTLGFAQAAQHYGARLYSFTQVKGIKVSNGQVTGVVTNEGEIRTKIIVNAAGVGAPEVGKMVGLEIPIKPRRGQIVITEQVPPLLKGILTSTAYLAAKGAKKSAKITDQNIRKLGAGLIVEQSEEGNLILGSTREFVGYNKKTSYEGICAILGCATKAMPILREVHAIRSFAGLRPTTPDGLPIIGRAPGLKEFIIAAGHEGDGIALAPITGKLVADLIIKEESPAQLDHLNLERFMQ